MDKPTILAINTEMAKESIKGKLLREIEKRK